MNTFDRLERAKYAFGHLISSHNEQDPHAADSAELAREILHDELGFCACCEMPKIEALAEYVAGNYTYTGEAEEIARKIETGEL